MSKNDRESERSDSKKDGYSFTEITINEEQIAAIDAKYPNPEQRANKLWNNLNIAELDQWDLVCFCAQSLGLLAEQWPWLLSTVKQVNKLVYIAHYTNAEQLFGDKK